MKVDESCQLNLPESGPYFVLTFGQVGFSFKGRAMSDSALPPDVRRWLCPADGSLIISGLCPRVRA